MTVIDDRLLEPNGEPEIRENFNRTLTLLDGAEGTPGPPGPQGVGIRTVAGSIDGTNKLTLTFTLTDDSVQTVEGQITPPAAG